MLSVPSGRARMSATSAASSRSLASLAISGLKSSPTTRRPRCRHEGPDLARTTSDVRDRVPAVRANASRSSRSRGFPFNSSSKRRTRIWSPPCRTTTGGSPTPGCPRPRRRRLPSSRSTGAIVTPKGPALGTVSPVLRRRRQRDRAHGSSPETVRERRRRPVCRDGRRGDGPVTPPIGGASSTTSRPR